MSFNFSVSLSAFEAKIAQFAALLPSIGQLVLVAETVLPQASGLTKAGLVINTLIAAEPTLEATKDVVQSAITNVVTAYRDAGKLPMTDSKSGQLPVSPPPAPPAPNQVS